MENFKFFFSSLIVILVSSATVCNSQPQIAFKDSPDLLIKSVSVTLMEDLDQFVFEIRVAGTAGKQTPQPVGQLDGAPVLGYVFPTTLRPTDVGFRKRKVLLHWALTSHPDFDDTPLWDENRDQVYDNDGIVWHPHWVVLTEDKRVAGGLAVKQFDF